MLLTLNSRLITQNRKYGIFATLLLLMIVAPLSGQAAPPPPGDSIAPVLEKVLPAVVNISTSKVVGLKQRQLLLDTYFHQPYAYRDRPVQKKSQSLGSGVIVDAKKGWVITNHHVVDGADEITVAASHGERSEGW